MFINPWVELGILLGAIFLPFVCVYGHIPARSNEQEGFGIADAGLTIDLEKEDGKNDGA